MIESIPFDVFEIINQGRAESLGQALALYESEKAAHDALKATVAQCMEEVERMLHGQYMPSSSALWTALFPLWSKVPPADGNHHW
jgi:hypothetical protein